MSPPRHTLVYIPKNSGITRNNLERLRYLMEITESEFAAGEFRNEALRNINNIYNKIKQTGGHATRNNAKRVTARPLELYRALALRQPENVLHWRRGNAGWRKFQEAAGKFKALGKVRAMRRSGNNASPSRRRVGQHNLNALATFMRPYVLSTASPVRISQANYKEREQKQARNAAAKAEAVARRQRNAKRARNEAAAEGRGARVPRELGRGGRQLHPSACPRSGAADCNLLPSTRHPVT